VTGPGKRRDRSRSRAASRRGVRLIGRSRGRRAWWGRRAGDRGSSEWRPARRAQEAHGSRHARHPVVGRRSLDTATAREHGRVLRVRWIGGFEPLAAVRVVSGRARLVVKVSELAPPSYAASGSPIGIAAIAIGKCIDIRLRKPIGRRAVVDAVTHRVLRNRSRRGRRMLPAPRNCRAVDADRRFDPPLDLTHRGSK
jgi:hypothetical protein